MGIKNPKELHFIEYFFDLWSLALKLDGLNVNHSRYANKVYQWWGSYYKINTKELIFWNREMPFSKPIVFFISLQFIVRLCKNDIRNVTILFAFIFGHLLGHTLLIWGQIFMTCWNVRFCKYWFRVDDINYA